MRRHRFWAGAIALAAAASLGACNNAKEGADGAQAPASADVQAIKDAEAAMVAGLKAKDVEKVVAFYGSTAMLFAPGQTPTRGSDQLRYEFKNMLGDPAGALSFAADRVEVSASGDFGYSRGSYTQAYTDPATKKVVNSEGSYVTIFKKTANGTWRAIEDMNVPTKPAANPATPAKPAPPPSGAVDTAAIETALKALEAQWVAAFKTHNGAKIASFFAPDGTAMQPGAPVMNGAAAIAAGLGEAAKDPAFSVEFSADAAGVAASGDLAYTRGTFHETATDPATKQPAKAEGFYLTVWRRQADGSWKAVQDIITPGIIVPPK